MYVAVEQVEYGNDIDTHGVVSGFPHIRPADPSEAAGRAFVRRMVQRTAASVPNDFDNPEYYAKSGCVAGTHTALAV